MKDLSPNQDAVLAALHTLSGEASVGDLADATGISATRVFVSLTSLHRKGDVVQSTPTRWRVTTEAEIKA